MKKLSSLRLYHVLIIAAVLVLLFGVAQSVFAQSGPQVYTVKSGDTLGSIALAHQVMVESLLAANPSIQNPNQIFVGQKVTIPAANLQTGQSIWTGYNFGTPTTGAPATTTPTATGTSSAGVPVTGGSTYVVKPGDSLGSIAVSYQVTVASLLQANPGIQDPSLIYVGQVLTIPATKLQAGQSIWSGYTAGTPAATTSATASPTATPTP